MPDHPSKPATTLVEERSAAVGDAVVATDLEGRIEFFDPGAEHLFERSRANALGSSLSRLWQGIVEGDRTFHAEVTIKRRIDDEGRSIGACAVFRDVTVRKQVEEALRYRAAFDRVVTELSTDFIKLAPGEIDAGINRALQMIGEFSSVDRSYVFLYDDTRKLMTNTHEWCAPGIEPQMQRIRDIPVEALGWINERILRHETVHVPRIADLPPEAEAIRAECLAQGIQSFVGVPLISGGECIGALGFDAVARSRWSEDNITTLKLAAFAIADAVVRKQADEKLRASEEKLRRILESSPDAIALTDLEGRIIDCNQATLDLLGLGSHEQAVGVDTLSFFEDQPYAEARLAEIRRVGVNKNTEHWIAGREGKRFLCEISASVIQDPGGEPTTLVAIAKDITARRQAEEERARLEEQLHQARKMEAIGRLAGGVAHDFNNVLCAIIGNAALSLDQLQVGDPLHELLDEISRAAERAADLTKQLLAFSRRQIIEPKVINLSILIDRLQVMLVRLIGEDINLRTDTAGDLGLIRADPSQIEQVVLNLVLNARDAMPGGGDLQLSTANVMFGEGEPRPHVLLAVRDTGCGMSPEVQARIFEPFYTTKELGQGTGLGLATVFGIVEQAGGKIEVSSTPGEGSVFRVYLPRLSDAAEASAGEPSSPTRVVGGRETILVVEDDEMVRSLAVRMLERLGYTILSASSAAQALVTAESHPGPIHLLFTDIVMPRMNGRELARRLTSSRTSLRTLYTSGYTQDVIGHHGILDQDVQYLAKPYSLATLAARVRQVLDQR